VNDTRESRSQNIRAIAILGTQDFTKVDDIALRECISHVLGPDRETLMEEHEGLLDFGQIFHEPHKISTMRITLGLTITLPRIVELDSMGRSIRDVNEMADGVGIPFELMNFMKSIEHVFTPVVSVANLNRTHTILELLNVPSEGDHVGLCVHIFILVRVAHKGDLKVNTHSMLGLCVGNNV
jgi:hypothetical protein